MKQGLVKDEDRISRSPEEVILHILSFLPTKDAVATSAFAKQWRSRWKMVPVLDFDYESDDQSGDETFPEMLNYFNTLKFCVIENATELVEAQISDVSNTVNDNILGSLTSAKRLCLDLSLEKITFPMGCIFYQLVYLELKSHKAADWRNLLVLMLDRSPELQVLKLNGLLRNSNRGRVAWSQPKNVAECLLFSLETFVWESYKERPEPEEEKEVAKYILTNAKCLKRATVYIEGLSSDDRLDLLEELESVVRASNSSCQISMLD
ncbi:unnamed protein product [Microthlaspi erraticum]|uniref:FBD domain-containing protein n=1 Tax=Microthlaspi erraticum TaxID=1685480 RepID=A0A6D2HQK6_9BRAS|nr:unnamed protein product [Microthlaspi erraticum]